MRLLDLFSGIGGFHLGLQRAGFKFDEVYFSEVDKYAIDVYSNNFKHATHVGSVTDVYGGELPRINAITFGSPCQDFSQAGARKGLGGNRSSLISEAIRLIKETRPDFFIWENVKGTFSSNNRQDFAAILQAFANIGGYRLEWQLLNTKWFLPQNRERVYLVGYLGGRSGQQVFPIGEITEKNNELPRQSADTCTLTARYRADGNGSYIIERKLNAQAGTWRTHKDGNGFRGIKDGDSPTIPARAREDGSGQPVVKEGGLLRRFTPIECERLQGFPDNWTQYGAAMGLISDTQRYKMCGNAVTVNVVEAVGKRIKAVAP